MPPPKKGQIRTLNDLTGSSLNSGDGRQHESAYHKPLNSNSKNNNKSTQPSSSGKAAMTFDAFRVAHIPTLPSADSAKEMLARVCKEFEPIIKRRGYNVKSVSEMCCCFDGLDFTPKTGERSKGRKCRVMAHNVWGYNQTTTRGRGYKSHTVHLRLRHPRSHDRLLLYEDVAGTMAHELAHCEIGPHNDAFNKLMDKILEEHMLLQSQSFGTPREGTVTGQTGNLAFFQGEGSALGSGDKNGDGKTPFMNNPRNITPGYKLGGDISFTKWMSPAQAACMAAEARRRQQKLRLRGQHCCKPCTITISDSDDEGEENDAVADKKPAAKKRITTTNATPVLAKNSQAAGKQPAIQRVERNKKPKTEQASSRGAAVAFIDLTEDDDTAAVQRMENEWSCQQCTYINQAMALACSMCTKAKA